MTSMPPRVGDLVRVERDETLYPSKGTWPQFRGRSGVVVEESHGEYGVALGRVRPIDGTTRTRGPSGNAVTWFQPWESTTIAFPGSQIDAERRNPTTWIDPIPERAF
jgi:hypothetical protein